MIPKCIQIRCKIGAGKPDVKIMENMPEMDPERVPKSIKMALRTFAKSKNREKRKRRKRVSKGRGK
jgi:hypothetical protein